MPNKARTILAKNLDLLMKESADLKTQVAVSKRAGVSQSQVSYMLHPENHDMSPNLDTIASVAAVFGLSPWQILIDPATLGVPDIAHAFKNKAIPDKALEKAGFRPMRQQARRKVRASA